MAHPFPALEGACVLVANRGECACRIIRTCQRLGVRTIAVYTEPDQNSLHTRVATKAVAVSSYLDPEELTQAAVENNANALHPGWGFLSENADFERLCSSKGILFIGPNAENMDQLTDKIAAKMLAQEVGVPIIRGSKSVANIDIAVALADDLGYPVMLKAANGGGGIGIYACQDQEDLEKKFGIAQKQVQKAFADDDMFLEKYIAQARHLEVQVFGDGSGNVALLGERECSVQRRHQKLIEETPAPNLPEDVRNKLFNATRTLTQAIQYRSAGTAEFLYDISSQEIYFMEFNTRLQVEHGVTEMCHGVDLVEWMLCLAFGCLEQSLGCSLQSWNSSSVGHAIQVRVYAENPTKNFQPAPGVITAVDIPQRQGTRVENGVCEGYELLPLYDPMIAKIIQWDDDRMTCIENLSEVLANTNIAGPPNNVQYLKHFTDSIEFRSANLYTKMLDSFEFHPSGIEVLSPGMMTTVQDWPGRVKQGLWRVGVPPSGAMDHLACRISNTLVGNKETDAVLEICITGPMLKFYNNTFVAVTGAPMEVRLDGESRPQWQCFEIKRGSILAIKPTETSTVGSKVYLSCHGGIDVPKYLDSRSTFTSGKFGGYQGRTLQVGDILQVHSPDRPAMQMALQSTLIPKYTNNWQIGCLPGPYSQPDYFTEDDIEMFHSTQWKVHHDSNRMGIRLIGPAPKFTRPDGGEGGSHPSNVHDYVYSIGSVNFTGNMPIIIAHDGPSLGGFVCPVTIVQAELWKIGQLRPGDSVQFVELTIDEANIARKRQNHMIANLSESSDLYLLNHQIWSPRSTKAVLLNKKASDGHPGINVRLSGDTYITIEYGPMVLDLNLRFRIHFLEKSLLNANITGLEETAPGVRTLQIRYNPDELMLQDLLNIVNSMDQQIPDVGKSDMTIECRTLRLPMCFKHSSVDTAIQRYMRTIRKDAPYLPSNIEFIAKNNGLESGQDVFKKIFAATYLCLGLGDVYLNSPCAVPINPLHRVVNPKYNPARTYTAEGTVGLGGAYMCLYTMDSPGGYQLVGRSLPIWNTYGITNEQKLFSREKPWLFEMFDQISFYPVQEAELEKLRLDFKNGRLRIQVDKTEFSISKFNSELAEIQQEVEMYQNRQKKAAALMNEAERLSLLNQDQLSFSSDTTDASIIKDAEPELASGQTGKFADMPGMVGDVFVSPGDQVNEGDVLLHLCAMKMENASCSDISGTVCSVFVKTGEIVSAGKLLVIIE